MEWLVSAVNSWFSWVYMVTKAWPDYSNDNDPNDSLFLVLFLGLVCIVLGMVLSLFLDSWRHKKGEKKILEVSSGVKAWEVDRSSLWVRYYYFWLCGYPSNICQYVKHSAFMLFASLLLLFGISNMLFALLALVSGMMYLIAKGVVWFFINLPELFLTAIWSVWSAILSIPSEINKLGKFTYEQGWDSYLIIFAGTCSLLYLLFRSRSYQVLKLWIKSFKENICIPIRVK